MIHPSQWSCPAGHRRLLFENKHGLRCLRCPVCELDFVLYWLSPEYLPLTPDDCDFLQAVGVAYHPSRAHPAL